MSRSVVIGVDVGGTFTDILALDEVTGEVKVAKVPSTKGDQSAGFLEGILAATFIVSKKHENLDISFNPVSVLVPSLIRNFLKSEEED